MNVTVYGLIDPRDRRCRYVGKTKHAIADRLRGHLSDARRRGSTLPRFRWINQLSNLGLKPEIVALEIVHENDWQTAEQMWVHEMRARFSGLLNATDGGDGIHGLVHSAATKRMQSVAAIARYQRPGERQKSGAAVKEALARPEVREKLRANAKVKCSDPAFLAALSKSAKEYANRPEVRAERSAALKGRVFTPEWRAKISESKRGQTASQETKAKLSAARIGRKHSEATKEKIRLANRQRVKGRI